MIAHLVTHVVECLNMFPRKNGISDTMSPSSIVTGRALPDFNKFTLEFGSYVQVFEDNNPCNTIKARTLGAICLGHTGNAHGDHYFLSLATGERIVRRGFTHIENIPDTAIARVEALALMDDQPLIQNNLLVEWRPNVPIDESIYDADYNPTDDPDDEDLPAEFNPIDPDELEYLLQPTDDDLFPPVLDQGAMAAADELVEHDENVFQPEPEDQLEGNFLDGPDDDGDDDYHDNDDNAGLGENQGAPDGENEGAPEENQGAPDGENEGAPDGANQGVNDIDEDVPPTPPPGYNLRPRQHDGATRWPRFQHALDDPHSGQSYFPPTTLLQTPRSILKKVPVTLLQIASKSIPAPSGRMRQLLFGFVMTQMSEKSGYRKHGKRAEQALMDEFRQLHDLHVFFPMFANELTPEQRKSALRAINLIKEKRDGRLKGRTVADGRPQRSLYDKSETASPTVSADALLATIMIDAHEKRNTATADVVGAYLKALMDEFVLMKFTGKSVEIICEMDDMYKQYVTAEKGVKTLYVRLNRALYGCVKSALLWYNVFAEALQDMGFELNPYDQCVANCMIDGAQCTVAWYVDDTKISHRDEKVVTQVIEKIEAKFGKMSVTTRSWV